MRVALFPTCIVDAVAVDTGIATVRVLERLGHEVIVPEQTTCCGQPAWNAGHAEPSAEVARTTLRALDEADAEVVVVPAGSCTTMIRVFWRELFHLAGDDADAAAVERVLPRVKELSEFLVAESMTTSSTDPSPTVYHRSCHMLRELGIDDAPERLLDQASDDRRVPEGQGRCCGFGGLFSVKLPEVSVAMADDVLDAVVETGAERVVGCDASCLMHLEGRAARRDLPLRFEHLASSLERATRKAP